MLPSTGYFKEFTCPFFNNGLCERPYCHYKHVRRDNDENNDIGDSSDILKQIVSEAVKKALLQSDNGSVDIETKSKDIVTEVVKELKPSAALVGDKPLVKATYNPTPISELNRYNPVSINPEFNQPKAEYRKHIPVPYTPHRPSRSQLTRAPTKSDSGPLTLSLQEPVSNPTDSRVNHTSSVTESDSTIKYLPGSKENPTPYSPIGQPGNSADGVTYTPSDLSTIGDHVKTSGYSPVGQNSSGMSYNPGVFQPSTSNNYCPTNSTLNQTKPSDYVAKFSYKPTPLAKQPSPQFSSDEDEPSNKKPRLSGTEELDDLDVEFEMLGEILEDENSAAKKTAESDTQQSINSKGPTSSHSNNGSGASIHKRAGEQSRKSLEASMEDQESVAKEPPSDKPTKTKRDEQSSVLSSSSVKSTSKDEINADSPSGRDPKANKTDRKHLDKKEEGKSKDTSHTSCGKSSKSRSSEGKGSSSKDKDRASGDKTSSSKEKDTHSKDKHSSSRHKEKLPNDISKKSNDVPAVRSSNDHRKTDKPKNSSNSDSRQRDSSSKHSDKDHTTKSKSHSNHDTKHESVVSSDKKHKKSTNDEEKRSDKSRSKQDKDRSHKSSSSSSKSHHKHKSSERTSSKTDTSHTSDGRRRSSSSKSKQMKQIDLFSVSKDVSDKDSDVESVVSDVIEILSESDEETITQECMKIFEEYVPVQKSTENIEEPTKENQKDSSRLVGKKRIAHDTKVKIYRTPTAAVPNHKAKAIQMVTDRYAKVKQFHNERLSAVSSPIESPPIPSWNEPSTSNAKSTSKVRIAHVPYASTLINAKKALNVPPESPKHTTSQTISKGTNRVAHVPNDKFSDRPTPLEPLASKVPMNIRSKYLNLMIDNCLKIYLTAEDAYERALNEELCTNKKCTTITIYKNSALMTVARLRKEIKEAGGKKIGSDSKTVSHSKIMLGKKGETVSWSIENKYRKDVSEIAKELQGERFYDRVYKWVLSEEELKSNGFPRPHPEKQEKGCAKIYTQNMRLRPQKGFTRCCVRCKRDYTVDKKGVAVVKEECIYHPNNKYRFRGEVKYQCCSQDASSDGCLSASCHVFEYVDHENLRGYVTTLPKSESFQHGVYALDCEMCYTTNGLDLTRVTVINSNLKVVYETLVKPIYPIIDYNTNFSGITHEQMKDVTTSLLEVQATLLHMFSDKTILVGHSLESDFKALKLIHNTVVDTSVLFPHKMGPPYKRALRNLSSEYLKKIIQNSVDGHDSAEDALVCMELLMWKVKEEMKH